MPRPPCRQHLPQPYGRGRLQAYRAPTGTRSTLSRGQVRHKLTFAADPCVPFVFLTLPCVWSAMLPSPPLAAARRATTWGTSPTNAPSKCAINTAYLSCTVPASCPEPTFTTTTSSLAWTMPTSPTLSVCDPRAAPPKVRGPGPCARRRPSREAVGVRRPRPTRRGNGVSF